MSTYQPQHSYSADTRSHLAAIYADDCYENGGEKRLR